MPIDEDDDASSAVSDRELRLDRSTGDEHMTSVLDGRTHAIAAADLDTGIRDGRGRYRAVCGATVISAALASAPGHWCPSCRHAVDAADAASAAEKGRHRSRRWPPPSLPAADSPFARLMRTAPPQSPPQVRPQRR